MRASLFLVCALALGFVAGCVSQDTAKLRIGMTKDEVIAVMGKPESVGADGRYEYLNYRVTTQNTYVGPTYVTSSGNVIPPSTRTSSFSQPYIVRLAEGLVEAYGTGSQLGSGRTAFSGSSVAATIKVVSHRSEAAENGIRILSIEPATATPGKATTFKIRIAYSLKEVAEGAVVLSFNTLRAHAFPRVGAQTISPGSGELEVTATVTPRDWGQLTDFAAQAVLVDGTNQNTGKIISSNKREILLTK